MSRFWTLLIPIHLSMALSLSAQADVHQQLRTAAQLASQGHYQEAIELARPALESEQVTEIERGRGWIVLASAYESQGRYQEATTAYESALQILRQRDEDPAEYATALSAFGTLYRDMFQFDAAARMEMRALQVDQQINDHAGIAADCASLADLELGLKHTRKAQLWLDKAIQESKLAPTLGNDFYAFVTSSQAWLAELRGNTPAAIAGFQKEIDYLTRSQDEQNPSLGWAYMVLGKAYLKNGNSRDGLGNMRKGFSILLQTVGAGNPRYLLAQVAYAEALDSAGMHDQAIQARADAEQKLRGLYKEQCTQCRITSLALH
jgi:tetratricopeptide (TPR) repeat protein